MGTLYIIAAPSGGGKTSLLTKLVKSVEGLHVSISYTTRPQRVGETEGVNYHFVTEVAFEGLLEKGTFLEHARVFGLYYGTSASWVREMLEAGKDVVLEIDWQGAAQVKAQFPECVSIFILPPSRKILLSRLSGRKQDTPETIARRTTAATEEIAHSDAFDYWVINDDFSVALADLVAIVHAQRLRQGHQAKKYAKLVANLVQNQ